MTKKTVIEQGTIKFLDLIPETIESFLIDRKIQNFRPGTLRFYRQKLRVLHVYCQAQQITLISEISTDIMRKFMLWASEYHNPGGSHAIFRACKTFLKWWELESGNPNPMQRLKPPKVDVEPLDPILVDDLHALLKVSNKRDKAIILVLIDTGIRATELININIFDLKLTNNGEIMIRRGKGGKPRSVFIGQKTRRALREYLKERAASSTLFLTDDGNPLTYWGLRDIIVRRSKQAGIHPPQLHAFRRTFALTMLRAGVDIYSVARLMGHADIQVLKRYLKQTNDDLQIAHLRGSPVDNLK